MAERKTLDGFLKFLLESIGDAQLAFTAYVDNDAQSGADLADRLREKGIDIQKIEAQKPKEQHPGDPKAYWKVPEGEESTSKLVG